MISYRKFFSIIGPWIVLALLMNGTRYFIAEVPSYIYMNWNLFLALVPLFLTWLFLMSNNIFFKTLIFFAWLLFLPNAPYLVSDLIHLRDVGIQSMLWFDGMMIFAYALVGSMVTAYSLILFKNHLFIKKNSQYIFLFAVSLASALGVYIGRHIRFNSWDVITAPVELATAIIKVITEHYHDPVFFMTLIFFTLFIFLGTYSFEQLYKKTTT